MGVKDLWSVFTPHAERKPISELRGKTVAIDLAGWVCESLNVVDYFVHPRHHLKNLFFRTTYLIWEDVTPIFVLEGTAPKLKNEVIAKRNELQFRGVKPKEKTADAAPGQERAEAPKSKDKGRTRFNHVLKQCESLLQAMGIKCVQGPGEAEAYCAFLNKKELVDGVISQDSDCFAYGAVRVYRNFSVSTQGAQAAQGGAVDIYDMSQIYEKTGFGQNKIIVMALLCGCDYCPDGIGGIGRDGVLKLFNKYKESEIIQRIKSWRDEDDKYTALEMRVDDKSICSNCGHLGRTQSHTKSGCGVCRTHRGCDESLWKEQRLSLKAELMLRKRALASPTFPNEDIIQEFLSEPPTIPKLTTKWSQPNIVKFVRQIGHLLQWTEIYCFQKFFPIFTRWHVRNAQNINYTGEIAFVVPKELVKKRTVKGVPSLELTWQDERGFFRGLVPDEQLKNFEAENPKGLQELWTTVEPLNLLEKAYPQLVEDFLKSKEKPSKAKKLSKAKPKVEPLCALENLEDLKAVTNKIETNLKPKRVRKPPESKKGLQLIDKFFKKNLANAVADAAPHKPIQHTLSCSTPIAKNVPSDIDSDCDDDLNLSDIVNGIVKGTAKPAISRHAGRALHYEGLPANLSILLSQPAKDDLDLLVQKRNVSITSLQADQQDAKRMSLDDSFDVLVNMPNAKWQDLRNITGDLTQSSPRSTHVTRFKDQNRLSLLGNSKMLDSLVGPAEVLNPEASYFFNQSGATAAEDAFEQFMELSYARNTKSHRTDSESSDRISISDSSGTENTCES